MTNKPPLPLRKDMQDIPGALSVQVNQIVYDLRRAGEDVCALSLGEAFFDIPLFDFNKLDITKGYHYSDTQGLPEIREKIAGYYERMYRAPVDGETEVLVSAGSKPIIYMVLLAIIEPGDEVLIHEPCWVSYPEHTRLVRGEPKFIPFNIPAEKFADYITPKTRIVIINNPNNPAGKIYSEGELKTIYDACRSRGVYLMVDEAYSDFVLEEPFTSIGTVVPDKDGIIIVNSLSKNLGMSGWRIGYVIAEPEFIKVMLKLNQHIITCAPTILLQYCARYFDDILDVTLPQVREVVEKRHRIAAMMDELGLKRMTGGTTFYFFVDIGRFPGTSMEFSLELLLEKFIAVVPGSAYGESTDRFIRVSIGTESEERIWSALQSIKELADSDTFDRQRLQRRIDKFDVDLAI